MNETLNLTLVVVMGISLGVIFFGGLWWTVQKVASSRWPALWAFGSLLLRTGIVLTGFYYLARDDWKKLLMCLLGFFIARFIVLRLTRGMEKSTYLAREASHAP